MKSVLFTGLFLLGIGIRMSGVPALQAMTRRLGLEAATKIMLLLACVQGFSADITWQLHLDVRMIPGLCAALAAGCSLTLAAMALGMMMQSGMQQRALQLGAAITLCAVGIKGLGVDLPQVIVLGPFFCGCVASLSAVLPALLKAFRQTVGAIGHSARTLTPPASDLPALAMQPGHPAVF